MNATNVTPSSEFAIERLARPTLKGDDGDRVAIVDGSQSITFDELDRAIDQVANGLLALSLTSDDRVAFVGRSCLAGVELMLGAARAGVVATTINWRLHPNELSFVLGDSNPRVVVTTPEFAAVVEGLAELARATVLVTGSGGAKDFDAWRESQATQPPAGIDYSDDDVVLQLYTSGTTGKPKGAMLTRRSLAACIPDTVKVWQLDASSVLLSVLPMFHIAGAGAALGVLWGRARLVIDNDPSPHNMLRMVEAHAITNLVLASVMLQGLIESPKANDTDLSSIRTVSYGAAPITGQVLKSAVDKLGCRIVQAYGLTETTGVLCVLDEHDHSFDPAGPAEVVALALGRLRSCGRPRPGVELRIVDIQTGQVLGPDQPGEVQARTDRLMSGYWNRPEDTTEVLLADGWFATGDVGELDADGYLFLRDRLKDTIISGGENIYPTEVEDALQWHSDVAEVAVIGIPDDKWGETPRAVVVLKPGASLTGEELIGFARERIAAYKCPTSVEFVDALPRNATGKVLRRDLREPYWAGRQRRIN